jgi:hypothetical protein
MVKTVFFGFMTLGMVASINIAAAGSVGTGVDARSVVPLTMNCSLYSSVLFAGGYLIEKSCGGTFRLVSGLGSTISDADSNAEEFGKIAESGGRRCHTDITYIKSFPGGYYADFSCSGGGTFTGIGTTATDTGISVLNFVKHEAVTGQKCSTDITRIKAFPGGYLVDFRCASSISGVGTTATAAANNALDFAELSAISGGNCTTDITAIRAFPGGYQVNHCNGAISGIGTSATDAAENAFDFAMYGAAGGRYCSTDATGTRAVPGGYQIEFSCNGGRITGAGSTATLAAQDALARAKARWPER